MKKQKVLVITDHETAFDRWREIANLLKVEVITDTVLRATIDLSRTTSYAMAIIDANSDIHGIVDLCRRLRLRFDDPILLLTDAGSEWVLHAYEAGIDECITPAIGDHLLAAKVHAWLRWSSMVPAVPKIKRQRVQASPGQAANL